MPKKYLLNNIIYFLLLVLKGIYHYWKYFSRAVKQLEVCHSFARIMFCLVVRELTIRPFVMARDVYIIHL